MVRTSKCPGCKELKSNHSFGKPSRLCLGPAPQDQTDEEKSGASVRPASTQADVLQDLVAAVQQLSAEVKVLKEDGQQLRAMVQPSNVPLEGQSGQSVPPPTPRNRESSSRVTLPELRAMRELREQVDRRADFLRFVDSESDDSDTAPNPKSIPAQKSASTSSTSGKCKSGKEARVTSTVLFPQLWPHSFLCPTRSQREVPYDELTLPEFVAGYSQILQSAEISTSESAARLKHLGSLMYFAQQYEWPAVLNFHGAVLLEIERGLLNWGDSFFHLESRTLYGNPRSSTKSPSKSTTPVLFCRDYQRQKCSQSKDHNGFVRGEKKWLKHICAECWIRNRKQEQHREGSPDCPLAATGDEAPGLPAKN